jgi:hypothetical protein
MDVAPGGLGRQPGGDGSSLHGTLAGATGPEAGRLVPGPQPVMLGTEQPAGIPRIWA